MNVPGIEAEVHDFEHNIESDPDNFTSAVFEAGGIIHQLSKVKGGVNRNVTNGRIHQDDTYALDGKDGYKSLFDVFNERNLLTNQSIYDYGKIRVKALNGQIMGASPYPYGNGYPNQYPQNGYPNQTPYPNQYPQNNGSVPPPAYSTNTRVRTGTTRNWIMVSQGFWGRRYRQSEKSVALGLPVFFPIVYNAIVRRPPR